MKALFERFPTLLGLDGTHELRSLSGIMEIDRQTYVTKYYPVAKAAGAKYNLNPVVILAQAGIESAWGTSYMARNINNFFGITAAGKPNDFWKGDFYVSKTSGLKFRKYPTVLDCFSDFARLISSNYKTPAAESYSIIDYARDIANSPYIAEQNGDNREAYRKGIINNAVYILKQIGQTEQSSKLSSESKNQTPLNQHSTTPAVQPSARVSNQKDDGTGGGAVMMVGALALAATIMFFNSSNKKLKT